MQIDTVNEGGTLIAKTEGRVDGTNAREFQEALEGVIKDADHSVILDMEQLTYISSAGLRVILLIAKALERQDVKFGVCSLSDPIREIFDISGFDKVVNVSGSQSEALSAVQG